MKIPSNKQDKDEYCMDLAYAVREASLFRITGSDVDKGKKLLDQLIGKRCNVVSCHFVNIARLWKVLSGCQEDLLGEIVYLVWFIDLVFFCWSFHFLSDERMDPETKKMLNEAIRTKNLNKLRNVIDRCEKKGIEGSLVSKCRELQSLVEDAEGALGFAMKSMDEKNLQRALEMCDDFGKWRRRWRWEQRLDGYVGYVGWNFMNVFFAFTQSTRRTMKKQHENCWKTCWKPSKAFGKRLKEHRGTKPAWSAKWWNFAVVLVTTRKIIKNWKHWILKLPAWEKHWTKRKTVLCFWVLFVCGCLWFVVWVVWCCCLFILNFDHSAWHCG